MYSSLLLQVRRCCVQEVDDGMFGRVKDRCVTLVVYIEAEAKVSHFEKDIWKLIFLHGNISLLDANCEMFLMKWYLG